MLILLKLANQLQTLSAALWRLAEYTDRGGNGLNNQEIKKFSIC